MSESTIGVHKDGIVGELPDKTSTPAATMGSLIVSAQYICVTL